MKDSIQQTPTTEDVAEITKATHFKKPAEIAEALKKSRNLTAGDYLFQFGVVAAITLSAGYVGYQIGSLSTRAAMQKEASDKAMARMQDPCSYGIGCVRPSSQTASAPALITSGPRQ